MADRLEEIKETYRLHGNPIPGMRWLIDEVERLRDQLIAITNEIRDVVWMPAGIDDIDHMLATLIRHLAGNRQENAEIHDLLAEALGYQKAPSLEEDPNCPCPGQYVTGDHTAVTLAMEAANRIRSYEQDYVDIQERENDRTV